MNPIILPLIAQQIMTLIGENEDRQEKYDLARSIADASGKPLLTIGRPKHNEYPCSEVVLDIDAQVIYDCPIGGVVGDVMSIPYPDKYFGAALVSHVLEHLHSAQDAYKAWSELWRVSDYVVVATPGNLNLTAILHPDHYLWPIQDKENPMLLYVTERY